VPELPEVETVCRQLNARVRGKKIVRVDVHNPKVIRGPSPREFVKLLMGARLQNVLRRGKCLVFELSTGSALLLHLKMTGQVLYPGSGSGARVTFFLDDKTALDLCDRRLFAELRVVSDWTADPFIRRLGPDPLEMSAEDFQARLSGKKTKIKPLIMDQSIVAGIGNLYACEVLFKSRIHPGRPAASLSEIETRRLFASVQGILRDAIRLKGSSVDQFVQLTGKPGGYVPFHQVYGRQGKPCKACSHPIQRIALGGRGTYLCPRCQK
jgi:formamidopyrimidine-DNA glycosylase